MPAKRLCRYCGKSIDHMRYCSLSCNKTCSNLFYRKGKKPRGKKLKRFCKYCGENIDHLAPDALYCNKACKDAFYYYESRPRITRDCLVCGEDITHMRSTAKCCREHNGKKKHVKRSCLRCGKDITLLQSTAKYCGDYCKQAAHSDVKRALRPPAYCEVCGADISDKREGTKTCGRVCLDIRTSIDLPDSYIHHLLHTRDLGPEITELKRAQIRLKRIIANGDGRTPLRAK